MIFFRFFEVWLIGFNAEKYKIMQVGSSTCKLTYEMVHSTLTSLNEHKDLSVIVCRNLKFSKQC